MSKTPKIWTVFEAARYVDGKKQESLDARFDSSGKHRMVRLEDYQDLDPEIRYLEQQFAQAQDRNAELEQENFKLSAGQCIVDDGLIGDAYGNPLCSVMENLRYHEQRAEKAEAENAELRKWKEGAIEFYPDLAKMEVASTVLSTTAKEGE